MTLNEALNTHNEIDQQISRVRKPKHFKLWITPQTFDFEYEVDPIKQELAESGIVPGALLGYEEFSGMPKYDFSDDFLTLYATILSAQRASKNALKKNFIDLRKHNGWKIVDVVKDDSMAATGSAMSKLGKAIALDQYIASILLAPKITWDEKEALSVRGRLSKAEEGSLKRYWIESFYGEEVTDKLLRHDDGGKYQDRIRRLEGVIQGKSFTGKTAEVVRLLTQLIESAGLLDVAGKPDAEKVVTMESLKGFAAYCVRAKLKIQRLLGMELRTDLKDNPIQQLNAFLSLCGLKAVNVKTISKGDKKIYEYGLDRVSYDRAMSLIARRSKPTAPPEDETRRQGSYEVPDPLDKH